MERLINEQCFVIKCNGCDIEKYCYAEIECNAIYDAFERLKKYEDTGLTPEQILAMDDEYTKMAKELGKYKKIAEDDLK